MPFSTSDSPHPLVILTHCMGLGGAELSLLRILRQCKEWQIPTGLISGADGPLLSAFKEVADFSVVTPMPYPRKPKTWIHLPRFVRKSRKLMQSLPPVPCNLLSGDFYSLWAALKVRRPGDKVLSLWQGEYAFEDTSCVRKWLKYSASQADRLLASSPIASHANESGLLPQRVRVLNPALETENLDPDKYDPQALRREFGWHDQRRLAFCFGRIGTGKQQIPLARAFLAHPDLPRDWRLIIAGPSGKGDAKTLNTLCQSAPESLFYIGPRNDIPRCLAGVDLVLQPSILGESFGMAAVETLLMKRPLLCFPSGASPRLLGSDFPGFVRPSELSVMIERWARLENSGACEPFKDADTLRSHLLDQVGKQAWQKQLQAVLS